MPFLTYLSTVCVDIEFLLVGILGIFKNNY